MSPSCQVCHAPAKDQCARCLASAYCSSACQKSDWKKHRLACYDQFQKLEPRNAARTTLIVEIEPFIPLEPLYSPLLSAMRRTSAPMICSDSVQVAAIIDSMPQAVVVATGGLSMKKYGAVASKLARYAVKGGVVLHGMHFSSTARFDDLNQYWSKIWNLPWNSGSYTNTPSTLNPNFTSFIDISGLSSKIHQKALFLKVPDTRDAIYLAEVYANEHSENEAEYRASRPATTIRQSQAVCIEFGAGRVGYIGDVNGDPDSIATSRRILQMPAEA